MKEDCGGKSKHEAKRTPKKDCVTSKEIKPMRMLFRIHVNLSQNTAHLTPFLYMSAALHL